MLFKSNFVTNTIPAIGKKVSGRRRGREKQINKSFGASGVMVIVVRNGHGDTSSNPGRY